MKRNDYLRRSIAWMLSLGMVSSTGSVMAQGQHNLEDESNIVYSDSSSEFRQADEAEIGIAEEIDELEEISVASLSAVSELSEAFSSESHLDEMYETNDPQTTATGETIFTAVLSTVDVSSWTPLTATVVDSYGGELPTGDYVLNDDVDLGTYNIHIKDDSTVNLSLNGHTLTGNGDGSVIYLEDSDFTLYDNTANQGKITGGTGSIVDTVYYGGGIYAKNSTFTMTGGQITGNEAEYGGGISVENSTFTMTGGEITDNFALIGGGIFTTNTTFTMTGGEITKNTGGTSTPSGGGTYSSGACGGVYLTDKSIFNMIDGLISENTSVSNGGGVLLYDSTFDMTGGTISENEASSQGGGVSLMNSTFTMSDGLISENKGNTDTIGGGGGVAVLSYSTFEMTGGTISKNEGKTGGGISVSYYSTLIIEDGLISENVGTSGAGVYAHTSTFSMTGGKITENSATSQGGGVYCYTATFTLSNGEISGNTGNGVYLYSESDFTMTGGEITGNEAENGGGVGISTGEFTMNGGLISENEADNGGGVYCYRGTFTMENGIISGNEALIGGGIYAENTTFTMTGGEITKNTGGTSTPSGGGTLSSGACGGVYLTDKSIFNMIDGLISENTSVSNGGGVLLNDSTFDMTGGTISKNVGSRGAGVYASETTLTMSGGLITENEDNSDAFGSGAGIYAYSSTFSMTGGTISKNQGRTGAGIYAYTSTMSMTGGEVTENVSRAFGGGIYLGGASTTTITGGKIYGNTATTNGAGIYVGTYIDELELDGELMISDEVYLATDAYLTLTEKFSVEETNFIPIMMETPGQFTQNANYIEDLNKFFCYEDSYAVMYVDEDLKTELKLDEGTTYQIFFKSTDASALAYTNAYGNLLFLYPEPELDGYTFDGWFTAETGGEEVTLSTKFTQTTTVYPQWTAVASSSTYTITFDPQNDGSTSTKTTGTDGKLSSLESSPSKTGYTFDGWYTATTGGTKITTSTVFEKNTTVYAQWTAVASSSTYTITFDPQNDGSTSTKTTSTSGKLSSLASDPSKTGYIFDGWYTAISGGTEISTSTVFTKNTTVYAQWTLFSSGHTIYLDPNGGTVFISSLTTDENGRLTVLPRATWDDYIFKGWCTTADGEFYISSSTVFTEDTIIYAKWSTEDEEDEDEESIPGLDGTTAIRYKNQILVMPFGDATAYPSYPESGNVVTITPDRDKIVEFIMVVTATGQEINVVPQSNGTYYFFQPSSVVTIVVTYQEMFPFLDVGTTDWYYKAIYQLYSNGLLGNSNYYYPDLGADRSTVVTLLYKLDGSPYTAYNQIYPDVSITDDFGIPVTWARQYAIFVGYDDGLFRPYTTISRQDLALVLSKYAAKEGSDVTSTYNYTNDYRDTIYISPYAVDGLDWALENNILVQGSGSLLSPTEGIDRGEFAVIVYQLQENILN